MRPEFSALFRTRLDSSANSGESGSELWKGRIRISTYILLLKKCPDNNARGAERVIVSESSPINFNLNPTANGHNVPPYAIINFGRFCGFTQRG